MSYKKQRRKVSFSWYLPMRTSCGPRGQPQGQPHRYPEGTSPQMVLSFPCCTRMCVRVILCHPKTHVVCVSTDTVHHHEDPSCCHPTVIPPPIPGTGSPVATSKIPSLQKAYVNGVAACPLLRLIPPHQTPNNFPESLSSCPWY